ncbi:tyrosine-type recombinase/integrase [uncultured Bradyrhizobium sp.]|uniref:tyrosine-type recombinase/integrase n=1 Tax=uncultured Bradyrhizobium sp. TaxID=199684 RepID=UPI0035CB2708
MTTRHRDQPFEFNRKPARNILKNIVARHGWSSGEAGLYSPGGNRKYINHEERQRVLGAAETLEPERCLFTLLLAWTGARISEVLALTAASFQLDNGIVTIVTLKRRKFCVREVPIPPRLIARLDRCFGLRRLQRCEHSALQRLWPWHRATAWRLIKHVMLLAQVTGRQACPRGLRHAFGVGALQGGVPPHLIQRWMGHAQLSTTVIYMNVCGPDELALARRLWKGALIPNAIKQLCQSVLRTVQGIQKVVVVMAAGVFMRSSRNW